MGINYCSGMETKPTRPRPPETNSNHDDPINTVPVDNVHILAPVDSSRNPRISGSANFSRFDDPFCRMIRWCQCGFIRQ